MIPVLLFVLLAIPTAIFATQNTVKVDVHFFQYSLPKISLYLIVIVSFLTGVVFALVINIFKAVSTSTKLKVREDALRKEHHEKMEVTKKLHQVELENSDLQEKYNPETVDEKSI